MHVGRHEDARHFFGAYFHEDWDLDAADDAGVVAIYVTQSSAAERERVIEQVRQLLDETRDDESLDKVLLELGCYYLPSGRTSRRWLEDVIVMLQRSLEVQPRSSH